MQKLVLTILLVSLVRLSAANEVPLDHEFIELRPVLRKFCLGCHSTSDKAGQLDLERFTSLARVRKDVKPWRAMILQLESLEMPPKGEPQPTPAQRKRLIDWTRKFLDSEARARAGDPGRVPLRRLSNAEYDSTIRDLTGVDLRPARDFPADGAAGEGFTNAAEALSMSPSLMGKFINSAREIASHAVLLPNGFRFSESKMQRDWTNESLARLRDFYWQFTRDGSLPLKPYISALLRHRNDLTTGKISTDEVASNESLSPNYLRLVYSTLNDETHSWPLDEVRRSWRTATAADTDRIAADVEGWRNVLWNFERIGSYRSETRQVARNPSIVASHVLRTKIDPVPGQRDVVLHLSARDFAQSNVAGQAVWRNPRLEGEGVPTLQLRDYQNFGEQFEIDYATLFGKTEGYLAAVVDLANTPNQTLTEIAKKHDVDAEWLKRWSTVVDMKPRSENSPPKEEPGRVVSRLEWTLLGEKTPPNPQRPAINGWRPKGTDLPVIVGNSSDETLHIPGRISPHTVGVHPMPQEFVAVIWKSPFEGRIQVSGKVAHAHPACGNGVAWWLEKETLARSAVVAEGVVDLGKETSFETDSLTIRSGDSIVLGIAARDANHVCDMTEIFLTLVEVGDKSPRKWDLALDIANNVQDGNPHDDGFGNKGVWSFVRGPAEIRRPSKGSANSGSSLLARWRTAASDPKRVEDAGELAARLQTLLTGPPPEDAKSADSVLYDSLVSLNGALLKDINHRKFGRSQERPNYAFSKTAFTDGNLLLPLNETIELRLPAELFRKRQLIIEGRLDAASAPEKRAVQFQISASPDPKTAAWNPESPIVALPNGAGHKQLLDGLTAFRNLFPPYICYPHVIPLDEVVCLKTFHREDEPLIRLFLHDTLTLELDRLWEEHRFITKYPIVENEYLPLFIGFVTQDQPQSLVKSFENKRPAFQNWADEFQRDFDAAAQQQIEQMLEFASRAWRRPLLKSEVAGIKSLYQTLRQKSVPHEEAFRSLLARVLMSSSFLLHLEQSPSGTSAQPVNDWELASRLSYFLWSSVPDEELRQFAAAGRLHEPEILEQQTRRMLQDDRTRALAIEFGTQWIHVRGFDDFREKNKSLYPSFDETLRSAMYEESILFFQDLFQKDRSVTRLLDADDTFICGVEYSTLNVYNVTGDEWRLVPGVRKFGRGGVLGLGSVQAKQAGASRTSPVLRGNWVVETLLGEKLPKPPPNVPQLPEGETDNGGLSMRQIVEKHVSAPECAGCHQRIDPFGFAFEHFDAIGRRREADSAGRPLDATARLRDGTTFEGIDGLRTYLVTKKREQIVRLFCRRLVGYAMARSVTLSDEPLVDSMIKQMDEHDGRLLYAVLAIVQSEQFRMIRGREYSESLMSIPEESGTGEQR